MLLVLLIAVVTVVTGSKSPWDRLQMKRFCRPSTYILTVNKAGCEQEAVTVNACLGVCPSYVEVTWQEPFFKNNCQCCKATEVVTRKFILKNCKKSVDREVLIQSVKSCSCQETPCS